MAPWTWVRFLHPRTPDDLLYSRYTVGKLDLVKGTAQFVLALVNPSSPKSVVYILSVGKLSEQSVSDVRSVVRAVKPQSVVALVDAQYLSDIKEEEKLLEAPENLDVPTSAIDVVKLSFAEKLKSDIFDSRACLSILNSVFGTTFYGNVFAAKCAAAEVNAVFHYFRVPALATISFSAGDEIASENEAGASLEDERLPGASAWSRLLQVATVVLGDGNSEQLTGSSHRLTSAIYPSNYSLELTTLAPCIPSAQRMLDAVINFRPDLYNLSTGTPEDPTLSLPDGCPSFAVPFYPLFHDLHGLFKETPFINQALAFARKICYNVEEGDLVKPEDLALARRFRIAAESVRLSWNSLTQNLPKFKPHDFYELPHEEKCQALLAYALQYAAQNSGTLVAVVDANCVPGIRKHWNTIIPQDVAAYADYCFVSADFTLENAVDGKPKGHQLLENSEAKTAVIVSAGAAAALGIASLSQFLAPLSSFMKVLTFKVPTVVKMGLLHFKRSAGIYLLKFGNTAVTKAVVPAMKAAVVPNSTMKVIGWKAIVTAEKARAGAQTVVAAAERASLSAIRTAFYSVMRNRQGMRVQSLGLLGGTVLAGASVLYFGDGLERAIEVAPSAPAVARLGRGLKNLQRASEVVNEYENSSWWRATYLDLYTHILRTT